MKFEYEDEIKTPNTVEGVVVGPTVNPSEINIIFTWKNKPVTRIYRVRKDQTRSKFIPCKRVNLITSKNGEITSASLIDYHSQIFTP